MVVKSNARRSTVDVCGHAASGAALKCVVDVGSPTGLVTGVAGQLAAVAIQLTERLGGGGRILGYRTAYCASGVP